MLSLHKFNTCDIKYRKVIVEFKFRPYDKPCFDGKTRDECIDQCLIDNMVRRMGMYPWAYLASELANKSLRFSTLKDIRQSIINGTCVDSCGLNTDCYNEYFIFDGKEYTSDNSSEIMRREEDYYYLYFEFPSHPTTIYEISLKMQFEEYLCLIASILSLWFGFSILLFTEFCPVLCNKFQIYWKSSAKYYCNVKNPVLKFNVCSEVTTNQNKGSMSRRRSHQLNLINWHNNHKTGTYPSFF